MKELIGHLRTNGFELAEPILDGRIHRFRRDSDATKSNAWFWGIEGHANSSGLPYSVAVYGDWSTGEKFEFRSTDDLSNIDKAAVATHMAEAKKKSDIAKAKAHRDTADEALKTLQAGVPARGHPYLTRKQIKPNGTHILDGVLLVPMRDLDGRLWGLQRILADGKKLFLATQKTKGLFHVIPDTAVLARESKILFCEGFATGASLYEATGITTVVTFSADNLVEVVRAVVAESPEAAHLVCADDDRNTEGNPGMTRAGEAAMLTGASLVSPEFLKSDEDSTDFNDVHVTRGLAEVTNQIGKIQMKPQWVRPLGMVNHHYAVVSSSNPAVFVTGSFDKNKLFHLMPKEYWESRYPKEKGGGADFDRIASKIMADCRNISGFDTTSIVGSGVYEDRGEIVIHMGDRLWIRGREMGLFDYRGSNIYNRDVAWPKTPSHEYTAAEGREFLAWLNQTTIETPFMADLYLGLLGSQLLAGALPFRTHAYFGGSSGNGKTTLGRKLLERILPPNRVSVGAGSSEAGIRQSVGNKATIAIVDELESGTIKGRERVESVLDYARESSSGGAIVKGTGDSSGSIQYKARSSVWAIAVQDLLNRDTDENRFVRIMFRASRSTDVSWLDLEPYMKSLGADVGARMILRLVSRWRQLNKTAEDIIRALGRITTKRRDADKYAFVLAARHWLCSDSELVDVAALIQGIPEIEDGAGGQSSGDDCLEYLLNAQVGYGSSVATIGAMVRDGSNQCVEELSKYGIELSFGPKAITIPRKSQFLDRLFMNQDWARGYAKMMERIEGAKIVRPGVRGERRKMLLYIPIHE